MPDRKFQPGQLVATPGALAALEQNNVQYATYVDRHLAGDWGTICSADRRLNDRAVKDGARLLSAYLLPDGTAIWIITEAVNDENQRHCTTILLPDEY